MKITPHNPVYLTIILFFPWRWGKTYITIEDAVVSFGRYYCFDGKSLKKDISVFNINEVEKIGFSHDLNVEMQGKMWIGGCGTYASQEIVFETKTDVVSLNARPYTKEQIRLLIHLILKTNPNVIWGKRLSKMLKLD